jgi:hypothetical protein
MAAWLLVLAVLAAPAPVQSGYKGWQTGNARLSASQPNRLHSNSLRAIFWSQTMANNEIPVFNDYEWGISDDGKNVRLLFKAATGEQMIAHLRRKRTRCSSASLTPDLDTR